MRQIAWAVVILVAGVVRAEVPASPEETWEVAQIDGTPAGHRHTRIVTLRREGQEIRRASQELSLTVKRYDQIARLSMESITEEDARGQVVGVGMRMAQECGRDIVLVGVRKDDVMQVQVKMPEREYTRRLAWNPSVLGLPAQERLFKDRPARTGDSFAYQYWEPTVNALVTVRVKIGQVEEVELLGKKQRLTRATLTYDRLEAGNVRVQLPAVTLWFDEQGTIQRRRMEIANLGTIDLIRTTKEVATARFSPARVVDIGLKSLIPLDRNIPNPHATTSAIYRLTIDTDEPGKALAEDDRQSVRNVTGKTLELHVRAIRTPGKLEKEAEAEYLASCHYLDSDNPRLQDRARQVVGTEKDLWRKALRIERWVKANLSNDNSVPFVPASQVLRGMRGDCRQHAVLSSALCRAAGVPSRTALGLIYVQRQGKPAFGFHMWFEVFVGGRWVALDSTLGQGGIGAAHIKIAHQSWHAVESLTPLLPVAAVLGKTKISVVRVER